jgi:integrase
MRRTHQRGTRLEDVGDAWRMRYRLRAVENGQVIESRPTEYFYKRDFQGSKKLAQKAADEFMARINEGNMKPERATTFGEIAEKWRALILSQTKESSRATKESQLKNHILPAFGNTRLVDMTGESMQAWVSGLACSPGHIDNLVRTMRSILSRARVWGYMEHNPMKGLKKPKVPKGNSYSYTPEQTIAILNALSGWKRLYCWIQAETAMRPGEAAGLKRSNVVPGHLVIEQGVWNCQIQTLKTENAARTVPISAALEGEIRAYLEATPATVGGLLFPSETGRPISISAFRHRILKPVLAKLGIKPDKRAGLYAFKHGNATLMDRLNVPLKTRQARIGHADIRTTLEHYTHEEEAASRAAAEAIGALLNPKTEGVIQ